MYERKILALIYVLACIFVVANGQGQPGPSDTNNQPASNQPTQPPPPPQSSQPPPGQPNKTPIPSSTAPAPSTPNNTPAPSPNNNNKTNSSNSNPSDSGSSSGSKPSTVIVDTPTSSDQPSNQQSSSNADIESEGLSSSAITGIVIAVVGLVAIVGVFLYRGVKARKEAVKDYDLDFPGSPPMTVLEPVDSPDYLKMHAYSQTATPISEIIVLSKPQTPTPPSPARQASPVEEDHPNLSPPPFEEEQFDYNTGRSFADSYAESYDKSFSDSYSGYAPSFVGSTLNTPSIVDDDHSPATRSRVGEGSHWLDALEENVRDTEDEMRDTNDSYVMLQSDSFESVPRDSSFSSMRESSMRESSMSRLSGYSDMSYSV